MLSSRTVRNLASVALLGAGAFSIVLTQAVPAGATISASVGVSAGTLTATIPTTVALSPVTLSGVDQTSTGTLVIDVKDATGSGAGWKLQATSTQFKDTGAKSLSLTATTIGATPGITNACDSLTTCTLATSSAASPYPLPAASGAAPTATTFFNAGIGSGMGDQSDTSIFTVAIPANTLVPAGGAYTSTWTITSATAP